MAIHTFSKQPIVGSVKTLLFYLKGCDARCYKELLSGFVQGLHFQVAQLGQFSNNLCSAFQQPDIVDNELRSEICEGRTRGPFEHHPFVNLKVSLLGVIPNKQPGEYRMIHRLSYPDRDSVNDDIPPDFCSVHYAMVDDAVRIIMKIGPA